MLSDAAVEAVGGAIGSVIAVAATYPLTTVRILLFVSTHLISMHERIHSMQQLLKLTVLKNTYADINMAIFRSQRRGSGNSFRLVSKKVYQPSQPYQGNLSGWSHTILPPMTILLLLPA